ncbi:LysR family transcriptional regulator [Nonomuraea thailandensis]|uniref:LysR family transcriptional regulator n=1 Tax=Nonomuraea thailandensis TaxID=1188745 RepID=UPI0023E2E96A|nr:LysR family transcriptional regulator [Nonomuraea thailandensis]
MRRLALLFEIGRHETLTAAADALKYSPSAVSQQLKVLEQEVGLALVERSGRQVRLTAAGQLLAAHAEQMIARLLVAEEDVRAIGQLGHGRLRMATFRSAGESLLIDAITYFRGHYPAIQISVVEGEPEEYMASLRRHELDLALTYDYDGLDGQLDEGLVREVICSEPILVAVPSGRHYERQPLRLADLAQEKWIASTPTNAVHRFTERACAQAGFTPRVVMHTDDYHIAQELVARGMGVTFLPEMSARSHHRGVDVHRLSDVTLSRRIHATYRTGGDRVAVVAAIRDVLIALGAP